MRDGGAAWKWSLTPSLIPTYSVGINWKSMAATGCFNPQISGLIDGLETLLELRGTRSGGHSLRQLPAQSTSGTFGTSRRTAMCSRRGHSRRATSTRCNSRRRSSYSRSSIRRGVKQYARFGFSWSINSARSSGWHGTPAVLSSCTSPRPASGLYRALGYQLRLLDAPRRINCTGDRTPAREVPALRNR